jgi:hypothetical protein
VEDIPRGQAIVAWRFWGIESTAETVRLQSPFRATPWPVGKPIAAQCLGAQLGRRGGRRTHQVPDPDCRCGVYGGTYRSLRTFLEGNLMRPSASLVLGRVLLWGRVVADGSSWRATYGYPERLLVPTLVHDAYRVAAALEAYDAPVTLMDVGATFTALRQLTRLRVAPPPVPPSAARHREPARHGHGS